MPTLTRKYFNDRTEGEWILPDGSAIRTIERPEDSANPCIPEGRYLFERDLTGRHRWWKILDVGYSASITPTPRGYSSLQVGTLTGNLTLNAPTSPEVGDVLRMQFQQDGTGGHSITFNAAFKTNYTNTGNSAFNRASIEFYYDGVFWVQNYFSGGF